MLCTANIVHSTKHNDPLQLKQGHIELLLLLIYLILYNINNNCGISNLILYGKYYNKKIWFVIIFTSYSLKSHQMIFGF